MCVFDYLEFGFSVIRDLFRSSEVVTHFFSLKGPFLWSSWVQWTLSISLVHHVHFSICLGMDLSGCFSRSLDSNAIPVQVQFSLHAKESSPRCRWLTHTRCWPPFSHVNSNVWDAYPKICQCCLWTSDNRRELFTVLLCCLDTDWSKSLWWGFAKRVSESVVSLDLHRLCDTGFSDVDHLNRRFCSSSFTQTSYSSIKSRQ